MEVSTLGAAGPNAYNHLKVVDGIDVVKPLGTGDVLADRYKLVRRIGKGGMGAVWEAEHLALCSRIAIKLIDSARAHDEQARSRFLREAQAAASLKSPHVVQIFDYGVDAGTPYIAMELLEGQSLAAKLRAEAPLSPAAVVALLEPVFLGIAKAHEAGLVHRDLKPDNIFLVRGDAGEYAKVLDFGIAKGVPRTEAGLSTAAGTMLGTPSYMSPEQLMDAGLADPRSDLWSLAVIVYECVVGERPFKGDGIPEIAVALLTEPPPVPSTRAKVPTGFDAWFGRGVQRDPEDRFATVSEMRTALAVALEGPCVDNSSAGTADRGRKRGAVGFPIWLAALALVAIGAAAAVSWPAVTDRHVGASPEVSGTEPVAPSPIPSPTGSRAGEAVADETAVGSAPVVSVGSTPPAEAPVATPDPPDSAAPKKDRRPKVARPDGATPKPRFDPEEVEW